MVGDPDRPVEFTTDSTNCGLIEASYCAIKVTFGEPIYRLIIVSKEISEMAKSIADTLYYFAKNEPVNMQQIFQLCAHVLNNNKNNNVVLLSKFNCERPFIVIFVIVKHNWKICCGFLNVDGLVFRNLGHRGGAVL